MFPGIILSSRLRIVHKTVILFIFDNQTSEEQSSIEMNSSEEEYVPDAHSNSTGSAEDILELSKIDPKHFEEQNFCCGVLQEASFEKEKALLRQTHRGRY